MVDIQRTVSSELPRLLTARRVWIGYSGGIDSHVLLDVFVKLRELQPSLSLEAVHIHHGLLPQADQWQKHAESVCRCYAVPFRAIGAQIQMAKGQSLEEVARQKRYGIFKNLLEPGDCLAVAHHQDDQAETALFHFLRGSGLRGLASMTSWMLLGQGYLFRPFLGVTRKEILEYAQQYKLQWVEDISNQDIRFSRNFLRYRVIPILGERWPSFSRSIARTTRHAAEGEALLQELAKQDFEEVYEASTDTLNRQRFQQKTESRRKNLFRYWVHQKGFLMPSEKQMEQIVQQSASPRSDILLCVRWKGAEVREYRNQLYLLSSLVTKNIPEKIPLEVNQNSLTLPHSLGILTVKQQEGEGLDIQYEKVLSVRFRQGGEMWHFHGHRRTLKKCFQEWGVPVWMRSRIPLIYVGDQLALVAGYPPDPSFLADKKKVGIVIEHQPFTGK